MEGSNCIVFTTLHCRTQIFSDNATILPGGAGERCSYTWQKSKTEDERLSLLTRRESQIWAEGRNSLNRIKEPDGEEEECPFSCFGGEGLWNTNLYMLFLYSNISNISSVAPLWCFMHGKMHNLISCSILLFHNTHLRKTSPCTIINNEIFMLQKIKRANKFITFWKWPIWSLLGTKRKSLLCERFKTKAEKQQQQLEAERQLSTIVFILGG